MDNISSVRYINHLGGTKSKQLADLAKEFWHFCLDRNIMLQAEYLPVKRKRCTGDRGKVVGSVERVKETPRMRNNWGRCPKVRQSEVKSPIYFVNISVTKEDSSHEILQKKLMEISADLPKLINSVKAQELNENEVVLLSGLMSGRRCSGIDASQISWPAEVCLLQCATALRDRAPGCIILELNKFLLGLELVQESNLQPDTAPLRAEDDTNCSVSSIEEDFLTASEQLEEETDVDNCKGDPSRDIKKIGGKGAESLQDKKISGASSKKEDYLHRGETVTGSDSHFAKRFQMETTGRTESSVDKFLQGTDTVSGTHLRRLSSLGENLEGFIEFTDGRRKSFQEQSKRESHAEQAEESNNQQNMVNKTDHCINSFEDPATTGQYATNLAECVLQDAFIRLSQSETSFTEEAAVSISAGSPVLSDVISKKDPPLASRSWNELPKIVIVQSPDSYDNPTEWVDESNWLEHESPTDVSEFWAEEDRILGPSQSSLEVALACAASVIGTISSPQTAERIKLEQEARVDGEIATSEQQVSEVARFPSIAPGTEYSVPSALCGMTQVASAVAVCGLGEQKEMPYPATSNGLLAAADASAAVTLHCSIALGSSMEKLKDNIAKVLLKEASVVLTGPCKYKNIGEFIESMNERILSSVSSSKLVHVEDVNTDDLAHNLSDAILRHSAEEANRRLQADDSNACTKTQSAFVATATELLFNVMHFTCKKMSDLAQSGDLPFDLMDDKDKASESESRENQHEDLISLPVAQRTVDHWNGTQLTHLCKNKNELTHELISHKHPQCDVTEGTALPTESSCCSNGQTQMHVRKLGSKQYMKRESYRRHHNEHRAVLARENTVNTDECNHSIHDQGSIDGMINSGSQEKINYEGSISKDFTSNLFPHSSYMLHPSHAVISMKHANSNYSVADFADDLAETVVSMATEIAAICLENSHGKQPWFCAWKKGSECLMTSCRTVKRKKDTSSGSAVVRRHRPPRLSEIKKKTDEHPELKERLMNRVVDESINLDDAPDPANAFVNEVASKIMNLTESSVADAMWQGQNMSRNRLYCDRWSRGKASSYESIPEEDLDVKSLVNTLGPGNILGQPFSRTSSVSKQSSCESITDEFSRFMVNQMENEGREFELLLDYYAAKNANNILNSALQQVSRRNSHLSVRTSCLSKQSSTESITEEFYRYMLKEIDKENKDIQSYRNTAEWTNSLRPPSPRTPFCFRQSSMPCNRSSSARLTVNTPVKANSLDGFARSGSRDFLSLQPSSAVSSINLCKSDSCLYQSCQMDQATDMLIHETWSSSIEALMRKNKIIVDSTEDSEVDSSPKGSPAHMDNYANKLAADIVQSGKSLIVHQQDSLDNTTKGGLNSKNNTQDYYKDKDRQGLTKGSLMTDSSMSVHKPDIPAGPREVPLIQIEREQREETEGENKGNIVEMTFSEDSRSSELDGKRSISSAEVRALQGGNAQGAEVVPDELSRPVHPTPLSSSEDSTGSWSQLANEEENPEDVSSFLQLSEQSMSSNSNSSTTSSVAAMDLEACLEVISSTPTADIKVEEKHLTKETQENTDECTSGLSVGTASCQQDVSVINIDLEPECTDSELRATLQWIAASQLGIPSIYFRKSQEHKIQKFLEVTHLVQAKSWKVGDLFSALILHCKMQEQGSKVAPSFFDWLLELG
ncbi:A-kinase anchor protein SPHKAP [Rhinophrynus dorsalis]